MRWINRKYIALLIILGCSFFCSHYTLCGQKHLSLSLQRELQNGKVDSYDLFVSGDQALLESYFLRNQVLVKYKSLAYYAIHISAPLLVDLSQKDFLKQIVWSDDKGELLNDNMVSNANVIGLKQIGIYDSLLDGRGVIMGFVDSGLDYSHPDFMNENGSSRILYFWDQKNPSDSSAIFEDYGYGRLIVKDTLDYWIENNITNVLDPNSEYGHGTTVVGTACSNGRALQEQVEDGSLTSNYEGMLPASEIIMVASDFTKENWLASVADAVHFMLEKAQELGKPIVINLSVGTYSGSHDANDPVGQMINDWFSDDHHGRFLVCAGGNSRTLRYHLGYSNIDTSFSLFSSFNGPVEYGRMVQFESWIDSYEEFESKIGFYDNSNGEILSQSSSIVNYQLNIDSTIIDSVYDDESSLLAIAKRYMTYQGEQLRFQVQVDNIQSTNHDVVLFTYGIHDIDTWSAQWLGSSNIIGPESLGSNIVNNDHFQEPDSLMQIVSSFSCAENVITVSNYKNRLSYVDVNGVLNTFDGELGELALHSSRGPTRDGRVKPDVAASGEVILSAGPFNYREILMSVAPHKLAQGGWHMRNGGSSMASPIVAGIAAMYLQRCPNSLPSIIHEAILNAAYQDIFTGVLPNNSWGNGKVDGLASLGHSIQNIEILESTLNCDESLTELSTAADYSSLVWNTGDTLNSICVDEGEFWVYGIDDNGCLQRSDNIFISTNGIIEMESDLLLFPNPSNGEFIIKGLKQEHEIEVVNSLGQKVSYNVTELENGMKFELGNALPGIYLVLEKVQGKSWELIIIN